MITSISVKKSSLHCKTSISLSKPKRLQLLWSNFKHIEGYLVKKLTVLSSVLFLSSKVLIFIRTLITHFKKELAGVAGWGTLSMKVEGGETFFTAIPERLSRCCTDSCGCSSGISLSNNVVWFSCPQPSIATATNIDTLLAGQGNSDVMVPSEALQDKVFFIFNNLAQINMSQKVNIFIGCPLGRYFFGISLAPLYWNIRVKMLQLPVCNCLKIPSFIQIDIARVLNTCDGVWSC